MVIKEYPIEGNSFEYNGKKIDCRFAIERDLKQIIREAEHSHKLEFEKCYDKKSLKPKKATLYVDSFGDIAFGRIVYTIHNKKENYDRFACGDNYTSWGDMLVPNVYQESICW